MSLSSSSKIFAGRLFRTADFGSTWREINLSDSIGLVRTGVGDPWPVLYAVSQTGTVLRTVDGGDSWEILTGQIGPDPPQVLHDFAAGPVGSGFLVATTPTGVVRSSDDGRSWTFSSSSLPNPLFLAAHPSGSGVLYRGGSERVLRSDDWGATWREMPAPPSAYDGWACSLCPRTDCSDRLMPAGAGRS